MQVLVSADGHICGDEELIRRIEGVVEGALDRFSAHVTRVEVRLNDLNSTKPGERDKSCRLEAWVAGLEPVVAEHDAATLTEAIHAGADELRRSLNREMRQIEANSRPLSQNEETESLFGASGANTEVGDPVR